MSVVRLSLAALLALVGPLPIATAQTAKAANEQEVKVASLYNIVLLAEWPAEVGSTLKLCLYGPDRFGPAIDVLQGKLANARVMALHRRKKGQSLQDCQLVFLADPLAPDGMRVLDELRGLPVLTVADSPGAAQQGVALNMVTNHDKIAIEVNLSAARAARIKLSSKLLKLSMVVIQ